MTLHTVQDVLNSACFPQSPPYTRPLTPCLFPKAYPSISLPGNSPAWPRGSLCRPSSRSSARKSNNSPWVPKLPRLGVHTVHGPIHMSISSMRRTGTRRRQGDQAELPSVVPQTEHQEIHDHSAGNQRQLPPVHVHVQNRDVAVLKFNSFHFSLPRYLTTNSTMAPKNTKVVELLTLMVKKKCPMVAITDNSGALLTTFTISCLRVRPVPLAFNHLARFLIS
jgi:hypothetical protein